MGWHSWSLKEQLPVSVGADVNKGPPPPWKQDVNKATGMGGAPPGTLEMSPGGSLMLELSCTGEQEQPDKEGLDGADGCFLQGEISGLDLTETKS